ncbi:hypothetical protein AOQ72_17920 [Bradyrhizobium yuanmingense]|uniref:Uncharacterized protein n=2 Tax=Bradyrhizobium yuanmingense TaxID=108015 RepID=A0A0R3CM35_9BRAD|nr:hypothetical protein AOQ72_17920 [Bradyrhizobium yuanmingense]
MRRGEEFAQHGFDLLSKRNEPEQYFDALKQYGFFDPSENQGPVPSSNPDFVHIPVWPVLNYLRAVGARAAVLDSDDLSGKVLDIIRSVTLFKDVSTGEPRDNYRTYFTFAELFGVLPVRCITVADVSLIPIWLNSKYDRGLVPHALSKGLLKRLFDDGSVQSIKKACVVIEACLEMEHSPKRRKRSDDDLATVVDDHWLKEMLQAHAGELGRKSGRDAAAIFENGLRIVFSKERRSYGSALWRPAIETNPQNRDFYGPENRFVEGLRDVLDGWLEAAPVDAIAYVETALKDESEIIRRIALHTVTEHFAVLKPAFEAFIKPQLFQSGHRHELYRLLSLRFVELSEDGKAKVIDAIRKLPMPSKGEDRERRLKFTQREWLSAIKDQPEVAAWFAELAAAPELGPVTDHPDFLSYHESRWGPGAAPYETDSLVAFAEDGSLIERLNSFQPGNLWRGPTFGGLVAALEDAVANNPDAFLPLLSDFRAAKVPFQHALIQGYKKLFDPSNNAKPEFDWNSAWPKLMRFFAEMVADESFWGKVKQEETAEHIPTRAWMRSLIASFLENATRDDETAYPAELLPQGWGIITTMLSRAESGELSLSDPMTRALNTEKGHVVGAMYNHALRACRVADKTIQSHGAVWKSLQDVFDAELTKCRDGNFEFTTLSASYIGNLHYLSSDWLKANVALIFPAKYPNNFKVAIGGLAYAGPNRPIYQLLAGHSVFAEALATKLEDKNGRERVIEWVGLAYLWGDEQLESPIIQTIFIAGVEDVETLAELFWQVRRDELTDVQIDRVLSFWERCLTWAKERAILSEHFMARLSRLSPYIEKLDDRTKTLLMAVVPYVHTDYGTDQMIEELARLVDTDPAGVASLLERMLESSAPDFDLDDKLKKLIERLAALGLRAEAIRCTEKVRRTLPGMLDLYKKLVRIN